MAYGFEILIVLTIWIYVTLASDFYSTPHILSKGSEDIIESNDNYTVFCQGNKPLKWTIPEVKGKESKAHWTTFDIVEEKPSSTHFKYGLRLYITNMTYPYVGFYNCHYENAQDITQKNDENDRIYLFVNDNTHLAVFSLNSGTILNVYVVQHQTAVIPCRPTSPTVDVKLFNVDEYSIDFEQEYDSKIGFSFLLSDQSQYGVYMCSFSRGNDTFDVMVNVEIGDRSTSYIPAPIVVDENRGHTTLGDNIILKCTLQFTKVDVIFSWKTPTGELDISRMNQTDIERGSILTVHNSRMDDSGLYFCHVSDFQNHHVSRNISVKVYDTAESEITMREVTDTYQFEAIAKQQDSVKWSVKVWGHPESTTFYWFNTQNERIKTNGKYEDLRTNSTPTNQEQVITLIIKNIAIEDYGYYTLVGKNNFMEKPLTIFLNVTSKPIIELQIDPFHLVGVPSKVNCTIAAHPFPPKFQWDYKKCLTCDFEVIQPENVKTNGLTITSEITINATETGKVRCSAENSVGSDSEEEDFVVTDVADGFGIEISDDSVVFDETKKSATYSIGTTISASCGSKYGNVEWLLNNSFIEENDHIKMIETQSKYSNKLILKIQDAYYTDSGLYSCVSTNLSAPIFKNISFVVTDPVSPKINISNMRGEIEEDFPKPVNLFCFVKGIPKPSIYWYKNDVSFVPPEPRVRFENDTQMLVFNETEVEDQGTYKCTARYKTEFDSKEVKLKFRNAPATIQTWLVYIIGILVLALLVVMIYLIFKVRKERKMKQEMKLLGLANFEKGAVENINPELGIDDQAELLPYDRKWEFPIEQLKLGKQLGSGAFGVVLKGEAKHIIDGEPVTTVAVKMVKKNADNTYIKALASELKIMAHLGKHLNVVNLLGACTKNVAKRELLVIVEYCRFGNLQNFLLRHRDHYINQIDPQTGKVNYLIGQEELLDRTYSVSSNRSNTHSPLLKYAALVFSDSGDNSVLPPPNVMGDYRTNAAHSGATELTTVTQGDESIILSNNSIQPEWRSNYKGDYKGHVNPISTKDLIAFSFQIARGMDYLASRKVLHGDLAARNILLSDNNIVKICDFGLAKSMYKNDNYKKRGDCPLPVKWMAIESIRDRVFSTQSDVWSFGIVLWELFSMGRTPYPGMEADERLYHKLVDGYRLEQPEYSPNDIYQIMTECWSTRPLSRPSFTKLSEKIGNILEDSLRKHYIDLNDPYLAMNTKMLEGNSDYLAMLSPPTVETVLSPHYVNDMVTIPPPSPEEGYMSMNSSSIFSPRSPKGEIFDFTAANRKRLNSESGNGHELLPMLHSKNESEPGSPYTPNAVSNPGYNLPPRIDTESREKEENGEIVKSADNYVNIPQSKTLHKDNKLVSTPDINKKIECANESLNENNISNSIVI